MSDLPFASILRRWGLALASLASLTLALACGGGSSQSTSPPPPASNTAAQLRIGDAASDRIIDFEVTIASPVTITGSGGNLQLTLSSNRLELTHASAKMEPLAVLNVPQGTYTGASLTVSNPELTFLDNSGIPHKLQGNASQTLTPTFSPALTIGATPMVVSIDVNVANSVTTDASGNVTGFNFTASSFTFTAKPVAAAAQQEDDDGELEDVAGLVTSVSGNNFTMNVGQSGAQLTFATDNTTQFSDGLTNVASALNQIVKVEGNTRPDGTLFASEVEGIENQNGAELEGLITSVTGNPATALAVTAQDGIGSGMDDTKVGAGFTADVSGAQGQFKVDLGNVDTSGLGGIPGSPNFPFDASTVKAGQRVEVETTSAIPAAGGTVVADKVKLQQQAVTGTVANFTPGSSGAATFDLTLPADSYLTLLSGAN
ncbi:MAG TPA: DUF5666 domain-containing protein, partial [Terriglobales bacterium]|nr:DUF5666 domain-containing protein [Terriglobales bacterium]